MHALVASYVGLVLEQRDHIAEWVNLLVATHPHESEDIARCRAQAAFTMANTCTRNAQLRRRPDLGARLQDACLAVLLQARS